MRMKRGRPPFPGPTTPAEERVLELVSRGLTNAEIAIQLGISINTVRYHVSNLLAKAHATDRQELARWRPSEPSGLRRAWAAIPLVVKAGVPTAALAAMGGLFVLALVVGGDSQERGAQLQDGFISVAPDGSMGNGISLRHAISENGRYVAFESQASNLVAGDTNGVSDIFLRDRMKGTTTRISVGINGEQANGKSENPAITPDGQYVVFESLATNLVRGQPRSDGDVQAAFSAAWPSSNSVLPPEPFAVMTRINVYLLDLAEQRTELISVAQDGKPGNLSSVDATVSDDGRFVAFASAASNLVAGDSNARRNGIAAPEALMGLGGTDIFVRDRKAKKTERVSVATGGAEADGSSSRSTISPDGRWVAFVTDAQNLPLADGGGIKRFQLHDRRTGETTGLPVTQPSAEGMIFELSTPRFSPDGRLLVVSTDFQEFPPRGVSSGPPGKARFWLYELPTGKLTQVLERFGEGTQWPPDITNDRLLIGLGSTDSSQPALPFLYDTVAGQDVPLPAGPGPDPRNRFALCMSGDGTTITYMVGLLNTVPPTLQIYAQHR